MAILKGPLKLEGRVGDLIFYRRGSKFYCRSMPVYRPESMTAASKQSAKEFGQASRAGKVLRQALEGVWPVPPDGGMINRLNKTLYSALRKDTARRRGKRVITPAALRETLWGFSFNNKAQLHVQAAVTRQPGGAIQVKLPDEWPILQKMPPGATHIELQTLALSVDFSTGRCQITDSVTDTLCAEDMHSGRLPLLQPGPSRTSTLIVVQIRYLKEEVDGKLYTLGGRGCNLSWVADVLAPEKQPASLVPVKRVTRPVPPKRSFTAAKEQKRRPGPGRQSPFSRQAPS